MQKVLITLTLSMTLIGGACTSPTERQEIVYRPSLLERLPFVYKMEVQQGNIVTQEMVDSLQPGMSKRQVRFLLGTPLLVDVFHQDRWDYVYTMRRGRQPMERNRVSLHFADAALVRVEGDMRPDPLRAAAASRQESLVQVPDFEEKTGLLNRTLRTIGLDPAE
jgi:outer membrane protein assembly factor BamE